jgi:ABC-type antimicrobial peptide transport system permease subunit
VTATRRFNAGLLSMFGMIAIAIGAIGVYGTMAFIVARQTKAIGLRMALGASQGNVLRSVLWQSLWRVSAGVGLGLVAARAASGLFSFLVFGITTPSAIYVGVAIGLGLLGVLAALNPARRAANLDPLTTLRAE